MTIIWLIVWLFKGTPDVQFAVAGNMDLNNWAIALVVCLIFDIFVSSRAT